MKKIILPVILTSAVTALIAFWGFGKLSANGVFLPKNQNIPVHYASYTADANTQPVDFSSAAESSVKGVVHITTLIQGKTVIARDPFDPFGMSDRAYQTPNQMGSGSGVIISQDGYIVTNNHVVQGASKVQVTFNDRNTQIAKVIGTDPATDLAVLKMEGSNLPYLTFGNSDDVKLGQWVLAVGYPFNLDATVTAGIISAKGRSIGLNENNSTNAIDAYLQTDAVVNPGNSGGALVNTAGQLVGITAAIASPTGSYAGYSYAIPSNIVQKVANDLIKYGSVQRGYLGIQPVGLNDLDATTAAKLGINADVYKTATGVYVYDVLAKSGAADAGIKKGDFITKIDNISINSVPQLLEQIAKYNPGDKLKVAYERNGKEEATSVTLKNQSGNTGLVKKSSATTSLGAELRNLSANELRNNNLKGGAMVVNLGNGTLQSQTNIKPGFIIFSINDQPIQNVDDLNSKLNNAGGKFQIAGIYPGKNGIYYYGINNN